MVQQNGKSNCNWHFDIEDNNTNLQAIRNRYNVIDVAENAANGNVGRIDTGQSDRHLITGEYGCLGHVIDGDLFDDRLLFDRTDEQFVIYAESAGFNAARYAEARTNTFENVTD